MLGRHYQKESRLSINSEDKIIAKSARAFIQRCRCKNSDDTVFNRDFSIEELDIAFSDMDFNKSLGLIGIYGQVLTNLSSWQKISSRYL